MNSKARDRQVFQVCRELGGAQFQWRADAYEFVEDVPAFDLLCGTDQVRLRMEKGLPLDSLTEGFDAQLKGFGPTRQRYALYAD